MPEDFVASYQVKRIGILDQDGNVDEGLMPSITDARILEMYRTMVLARAFDDRAISLQREGRLGTYPPLRGQEAAQVGSAFALDKRDRVFPSFRESGVHLALGYPIHRLFLYWGGDERGQITPDDLNIFPVCVSVGSHIPHGVGAAMAARCLGQEAVSIVYFGDGATSKGDFHEGFNMAGVFRLPVVFICQNNQWAISVPQSAQTASPTLAQKAISYGFPGVQVDGNDALAVYRATWDALERARGGDGPTFIECLTYRLGDHTTSDDASRYRDPGEVEMWRLRDPIKRLDIYLRNRGVLSEELVTETRQWATEEIDAAVREMEEMSPPDPRDMFTHTLGELSQRQRSQMEELIHG